MFQLIESIRIENKKLQNIDFHNNRFNNSRKELFKSNDYINIQDIILIPENISNERYKCRVITSGINFDFEIAKYNQRRIESLKLVECNNIDYSFKTNDRKMLDDAFSKRENCDDILIVKNGVITDAWAANVIFNDGSNWYTPDSPLLKGTQREFLLQNGRLQAIRISYTDLEKFSHAKLINAMIDFERADLIKVENIVLL